MNPTAHHPQQLLDSSWRILEHVRTSLSSTVSAANLGTIAGDISISSRDSRRFQVLQRSRRRLSAPFGRSQRQKCGRSGDLSFLSPRRFANSTRPSSSSEQPRSLICMRVCSNLNRTSTSLPLRPLIPFHDFTSHHPSHPLDLTRPTLHPANTAILRTNHQGRTGRR